MLFVFFPALFFITTLFLLLLTTTTITPSFTVHPSPAITAASSPAVQWSQQDTHTGETADLPFFFLDAHEEPASPDTIYLFGKVPDGNGGFASCCCLVKNMLRTVFVIPKAGVVASVTDGELMAMEEAAGEGAEARGAYNRRLHVCGL